MPSTTRQNAHDNPPTSAFRGCRDLFARYGFRKTSVEDITAVAGVSKGSMYLEFRNKEEIFEVADVVGQLWGHVRRFQMSVAITTRVPRRTAKPCHPTAVAPHQPTRWARTGSPASTPPAAPPSRRISGMNSAGTGWPGSAAR